MYQCCCRLYSLSVRVYSGRLQFGLGLILFGIRFHYICTLMPNTPSSLPSVRDLRPSEGFHFLIKSAFILLAKLPSSSLFIMMVTLPHLAGESALTHTHTLILLPIQLLWKGLGGAAPHVFYSPIVLAVSLQLASSVCVSLSRAGASSYPTPVHTVNLTIPLTY